jgi:hypothetical protein
MTDTANQRSSGEKTEKGEKRRRGFFWLHVGRTAIILLLVLVMGGILALLMWKNPDLMAKIFPRVQTVETQQWGDSVVYPIEGYDSAGKHAAFEVAVLPKNLTWAHKSTSVLAIDGLTMIAETEVPERVFTPELREGLGRSNSLIAVGLASQEGQVDVETQRAKDRATSAAGWLTAIAADDAPIWMLNLGQFKGGCEAAATGDSTAWQRPLILVGVRSEEEGINLGEAFANAMSDKTNLPSRDCYTSFDLTRYR